MKKEQKNSNEFKKLCLAALILLSYPCFSQTSVFQDVGGESAYKAFGTTITINAKDENIAFSSDFISRHNTSRTRFNIWGINAKATADEGIANLKNEKGFLVDGELGLYKAWKTTSAMPLPAGASAFVYQKYVSLNLRVDRSKLFNLNNATDDIVYSKGYAGWRGELGGFGYRGNWLWGAGTSFGEKKNADDIDQKTISFLETSKNNDSVSVYTEEKAFDDSEFKGHVKNFNLNADFGYLISKGNATLGSLFIVAQLRYKTQQYQKPEFNPGAGIFLSAPGSPSDIVAGLSFQLKDLFNTKNSDNTTWQRLAINLTAGFKF